MPTRNRLFLIVFYVLFDIDSMKLLTNYLRSIEYTNDKMY